MKFPFLLLVVSSLAGCAMTPQKLAERAPNMETHELCMLGVKNSELMEIAVSEIKRRQGNCDWGRVQAELQAEQRNKANLASIFAAAGSFQIRSPTTTTAPPVRPAGAIAGFLEGQSEDGQLRYCRYSNGIIKTIAVTSICQIQD